jgi:hypothetical protein
MGTAVVQSDGWLAAAVPDSWAMVCAVATEEFKIAPVLTKAATTHLKFTLCMKRPLTSVEAKAYPRLLQR